MKNYVASQVAAKKAEGMLAPLIESDDDCESDRDSDADSSTSSQTETVKQSPMQKLKSIVGKFTVMLRCDGKEFFQSNLRWMSTATVYLVLAASIAASAAAMVTSPTLATYIMGGICIAMWVGKFPDVIEPYHLDLIFLFSVRNISVPNSVFKEIQLGQLPCG